MTRPTRPKQQPRPMILCWFCVDPATVFSSSATIFIGHIYNWSNTVYGYLVDDYMEKNFTQFCASNGLYRPKWTSWPRFPFHSPKYVQPPYSYLNLIHMLYVLDQICNMWRILLENTKKIIRIISQNHLARRALELNNTTKQRGHEPPLLVAYTKKPLYNLIIPLSSKS